MKQLNTVNMRELYDEIAESEHRDILAGLFGMNRKFDTDTGIILVGLDTPLNTQNMGIVIDPNVSLSNMVFPLWNPTYGRSGAQCNVGCSISDGYFTIDKPLVARIHGISTDIQDTIDGRKIFLKQGVQFIDKEGKPTRSITIEDVISSIEELKKNYSRYEAIELLSTGDTWVEINEKEDIDIPLIPAGSQGDVYVSCGLTQFPCTNQRELIEHWQRDNGVTFPRNNYYHLGCPGWAGVNIKIYPMYSSDMLSDIIARKRGVIIRYMPFSFDDMKDITPSKTLGQQPIRILYHPDSDLIAIQKIKVAATYCLVFRNNELFKDEAVVKKVRSAISKESIKSQLEDEGYNTVVHPDEWTWRIKEEDLEPGSDNEYDKSISLEGMRLRLYDDRVSKLSSEVGLAVKKSLEAKGCEVVYVTKSEEADISVARNAINFGQHVYLNLVNPQNPSGHFDKNLNKAFTGQKVDIDKLPQKLSRVLTLIAEPECDLINPKVVSILKPESLVYTTSNPDFYYSLRRQAA